MHCFELLQTDLKKILEEKFDCRLKIGDLKIEGKTRVCLDCFRVDAKDCFVTVLWTSKEDLVRKSKEDLRPVFLVTNMAVSHKQTLICNYTT